ncbi:MAG: hypothetical protein M3N30_10390, partial [Bacteroidota bacterium]|nr:hypothetical protein [Bacteroidota bacterium]
MKQHSKIKSHRPFPANVITVMATVLSVIAMTSAFKSGNDFAGADSVYHAVKKDSTESVKAFMKVYKVLMSPRCMNCHPAGDAPLQGDDSHIHTMNVQRGKDGTGLY